MLTFILVAAILVNSVQSQLGYCDSESGSNCCCAFTRCNRVVNYCDRCYSFSGACGLFFSSSFIFSCCVVSWRWLFCFFFSLLDCGCQYSCQGHPECCTGGMICGTGSQRDMCITPPACSETNGLTQNSVACQCGSSTCTSSTGLYCRLNNGGCKQNPPGCDPGTYSAQGFAPCSNCDPGQFSDAEGSRSCKNCVSVGATSYQDGSGKTSCKTCASPQVSTNAGDACTTCAVSLGPNSYLDTNNHCQYCQGCEPGSFKTSGTTDSADPQGCDVSCASCPSGWYKDAKAGSETSSQGQEGAWNAPCQQCASCLSGPGENKFRPTT